MRIRTTKPEFFSSPTISMLTYRARLTFIGLWSYVDDSGRGYDDARLIKASVWPLDDDVSASDVANDLGALGSLRLLERWHEFGVGRDFLRVRSFLEHQRINRPTVSKLPASPEELSGIPLPAIAVSAHAILSESSRPEGEREQGTRSRERGDVATRGVHPLLRPEATTTLALVAEIEADLVELKANFGSSAVDAAVASLVSDGVRCRWPSHARDLLKKRLTTVDDLPPKYARTGADGY